MDRAYQADGTLVPRSQEGAVLHDVDSIVERAVRLATKGEVVAVDGTVVQVRPDSLCIHGDTPGAVEMAAVSVPGWKRPVWNWSRSRNQGAADPATFASGSGEQEGCKRSVLGQWILGHGHRHTLFWQAVFGHGWS